MDEKISFLSQQPLTETQRGVKAALQSRQACKFFLFLSNSAVCTTSGGARNGMREYQYQLLEYQKEHHTEDARHL